jgi:hypothetical protein
MPIVNRPEQMIFPMEQFFDTEYHLRKTGGDRRSEILAEGLRPHLEVIAQTPTTAPTSSKMR